MQREGDGEVSLVNLRLISYCVQKIFTLTKYQITPVLVFDGA